MQEITEQKVGSTRCTQDDFIVSRGFEEFMCTETGCLGEGMNVDIVTVKFEQLRGWLLGSASDKLF